MRMRRGENEGGEERRAMRMRRGENVGGEERRAMRVGRGEDEVRRGEKSDDNREARG